MFTITYTWLTEALSIYTEYIKYYQTPWGDRDHDVGVFFHPAQHRAQFVTQKNSKNSPFNWLKISSGAIIFLPVPVKNDFIKDSFFFQNNV